VLYSLFVGTVYLSDNLGFVSGIPNIFFFGFAVMMVSSLVNFMSRPKGLFSHALVLLVVYAKVASEIVVGRTGLTSGSMPNIPNELGLYGFNAFTQYTIASGHVNSGVFFYGNWPGSWIIFSSFFEITGIDSRSMIGLVTTFTAFLWPSLSYAGLYLFLKNLGLKFNLAIGILFFFLVNWLFPYGFQPNAVSYVLFLFSIVIIIRLLRNNVQTPRDAFLLIFVIAAIGIIHLLTALIVISFILVLVFTHRLNMSFLLSSALIVGEWQFNGASTFLLTNGYLEKFGFWNLLNAFKSSVVQRLTGAPNHILVVDYRIVLTLAALAISFLGWVHYRKGLGKRLTLVDLSIISIIVAFLLIGDAYFFESMNRLFLYILPTMAYLVARLSLRPRGSVVVILFLVIISPVCFVAAYGNQSVDYAPPAIMGSLHYFEMYAHGGIITTISTFGTYLSVASSQFQYKIVYIQNAPVYSGLVNPSKPAFLSINTQDARTYMILNGTNSYYHQMSKYANSPVWSVIFANSQSQILISV